MRTFRVLKSSADKGFWFGVILITLFCNSIHGSSNNDVDDLTQLEITKITTKSWDDLNGKSFYTYLGNDGMSFFDAIYFCYFNKLKPAILTSPEDDEILLKFILSLNGTQYNSRPFWLTLNDIENEGTFIWGAHEPIGPYINWAPDSPKSNDPVENCVSAQQLGYADSVQKFGWINLPCSTKWRPLCQGRGGWHEFEKE